MKLQVLLMLTALCLLSEGSHAQEGTPLNCFDCVISIWDDAALTANTGLIEPNVPKDIYIGIKYAGEYDALSAVEFSIAGMRFDEDGIALLSVIELIPAAIRIGSFQAPADTSSASKGTGGISIAWSGPVAGDRALIKLQILVLEPITDKILKTKRRYPTTNSEWKTPVFVLPDAPFFTSVRISGGCYILNWSGDPNVSCDVVTSVEQSTWSGVKQLYR